LFNSKKKKLAAEAVQAQRAQASALQAQLDEVRSERARLETRLSELGETNAQLDRRLEALDQGVRSMGEQLVTLSSSNSDTNRRVRAIDERVADNDVRFDALNHRLDQVESYGSELDDINQRLRAFSTEPSPAPPPPSPSTVAPPPPPVIEPTEPGPPPPPPPSTPGVDGDVDEHIAELRERLDDLARQTSSVDDRVTSVSMELANQLTELSSDIDELNRRSESVGADAAAGVDAGELDAKIAERLDAALDDVLDSTERLATEQARYEIQFRSDLAELAERLRRPGTT